MRFLPKKDSFWDKNVQKTLFLRRYTACLESEEFYKYQIRIPRTFLPQKGSFLGKNRIFTTFRFSTQYAFPESVKRFFANGYSLTFVFVTLMKFLSDMLNK